LFLVAGWFSARSLAQRGAGAFASTRLLRLGVPLIIYMFLIDRLAEYLGDHGQGLHPSLAAYWGLPPRSGGPYATGPLWFVAALLAFSLAYALLRRLHPAPVARRWSGAQAMAAATVVIAVTAFLVWQRWTLGNASSFAHLRWDYWPQGAVLFALGVWAGEAGSLGDLTAWAHRLGWYSPSAQIKGSGRRSSPPCPRRPAPGMVQAVHPRRWWCWACGPISRPAARITRSWPTRSRAATW